MKKIFLLEYKKNLFTILFLCDTMSARKVDIL